MKRNTIALLAVLVLGGITTWLVINQSRSSISRELRDFAVEDTASVTKIFLADKTPHQVTLTRQSDGWWLVDGKYHARPDAIKTLMKTIHDLSVREPVAIKARDNVIKELATGSVKIEIYSGDKLVKKYYVGHETMDNMGTYMLLSDPETGENSSEPFVMEIKGFNGYLTPRYFTREQEWRDRTVFHYFAPDIRTITVQHAGMPDSSFTVTQSPGSTSFTLTDGNGRPQPFDTIAIKQFISYFGQIGFENFDNSFSATQLDSIRNLQPAHVISVTDDKGKTTVVKFYHKIGGGLVPKEMEAANHGYDPDHMYAFVNDGKDFVLVQYYVFGKLLVNPAYFVAGRKPVMMMKK